MTIFGFKKATSFSWYDLLNAIFINQLHNIIQTNCKTCYVGSAQVFLLHPIMMTNADCSDTEICKNTSMTLSQQKHTTSIIQYETGSELSPLSCLILRCENKVMMPNTKINVRAWERECITELSISEKYSALYTLYLETTLSCFASNSCYELHFSLFIGCWILSDLHLINNTLRKKCHAARFKTLMYETENKQTCFVSLMCVCMLKETWQMGVNSHSSTADSKKLWEMPFQTLQTRSTSLWRSLRSETDNEMTLQNAAPDRAWIKLKIPLIVLTAS